MQRQSEDSLNCKIYAVHRDLKPHNILLWWKYKDVVTVKIADFGLSKLMDSNKEASLSATNRRAAGWAAPEMYRKPKEKIVRD